MRLRVGKWGELVSCAKLAPLGGLGARAFPFMAIGKSRLRRHLCSVTWVVK